MYRVLAVAVALVALCFAPSSFAETSATGAKGFVDTLATQLLSIVKDSNQSKDEKTKKIEALFTEKVDIDFVAKFAMGKHWREATPEQQKAYIDAYKPFILKNYATRLTRYSGQTYTLRNPRSDGDSAIVTMDIIDPEGQNVTVDYRLSDTGNSKYKILDITVEGVSLLNTQRSEFNSIIDQKGIDGLIVALKNQVAKAS